MYQNKSQYYNFSYLSSINDVCLYTASVFITFNLLFDFYTGELQQQVARTELCTYLPSSFAWTKSCTPRSKPKTLRMSASISLPNHRKQLSILIRIYLAVMKKVTSVMHHRMMNRTRVFQPLKVGLKRRR